MRKGENTLTILNISENAGSPIQGKTNLDDEYYTNRGDCSLM